MSLDRLPSIARHAIILCLIAPLAVAISVPATAVLAATGAPPRLTVSAPLLWAYACRCLHNERAVHRPGGYRDPCGEVVA